MAKPAAAGLVCLLICAVALGSCADEMQGAEEFTKMMEDGGYKVIEVESGKASDNLKIIVARKAEKDGIAVVYSKFESGDDAELHENFMYVLLRNTVTGDVEYIKDERGDREFASKSADKSAIMRRNGKESISITGSYAQLGKMQEIMSRLEIWVWE
jgi:hypothetical protein